MKTLRESTYGKTRKIYLIAIVSLSSSHGYFCIKGGHKMSKLVQKILDTIQWIREANYAATLARNGKIKEAQAEYK